MQKNYLSKFCKSFLLIVLVAVLALTTSGCSQPSESPQNALGSIERTIQGEGQNTFDLDVVDLEGNTSCFEIHTDQEYVGDALLELKIIDGEPSEFGLFVKKVNDIEADYDKNQTYWAFYINGEYATSGVDTTKIEDNTTYMLKIEK